MYAVPAHVKCHGSETVSGQKPRKKPRDTVRKLGSVAQPGTIRIRRPLPPPGSFTASPRMGERAQRGKA